MSSNRGNISAELYESVLCLLPALCIESRGNVIPAYAGIHFRGTRQEARGRRHDRYNEACFLRRFGIYWHP